MAFVRTTKAGATRLFEVQRINRIVPASNGAPTIQFVPASIPNESGFTETMLQLYQQQSVTGVNLRLLYLTIANSGMFTNSPSVGLKCVVPTHNLRRIVPHALGAELIFKDAQERIVVTENLAAIMAQQSTNQPLGIILVTRADNGQQAIIASDDMIQIVAEGTGSRLQWLNPEPDMIVTESPATIFAAQA